MLINDWLQAIPVHQNGAPGLRRLGIAFRCWTSRGVTVKMPPNQTLRIPSRRLEIVAKDLWGLGQ